MDETLSLHVCWRRHIFILLKESLDLDLGSEELTLTRKKQHDNRTDTCNAIIIYMLEKNKHCFLLFIS